MLVHYVNHLVINRLWICVTLSFSAIL